MVSRSDDSYHGSIYIVHVAVKLTHEQAPDNSSALVHETAVAQLVIHHKAWIMLV